MHVKKADLQVSYWVPVRVSIVVVVDSVVVARAATFFVEFVVRFVVARADVLRPAPFVAVVVRVGTNTVVRGAVVRSVFGFVATRYCAAVCVVPPPRMPVFPSRTAAPALLAANASVITKIRIFFISDKILAKL